MSEALKRIEEYANQVLPSPEEVAAMVEAKKEAAEESPAAGCTERTYRNVTSGQVVHVVGIRPRIREGRYESVYEVETAHGTTTYTASEFHRLHERI